MFGNIFKSIGNAVTAPFKSVGDIVTGKGNLGDVLNIAGAFAPGGNFTTNLADFGTKNFGLQSILGQAGLTQGLPIDKWQPQDFLNAAMNYGQYFSGGGMKPSGDPNKDIASMMLPLIQSDVMFALGNQPRVQQSRMDAANALDPANQAGMYAAILAQAMNAANATGEKQGKQLKSQGFGDSVQAGAQVNAGNQAVSNVNSMQVNTPEGMAQAYAQIAQLLSGLPNLQGFSQAQQLGIQKRSADAQYNATKPPTLLENVFSIAGTTLPYILNTDGKTQARQGWSKEQENAVGNFARIQGMF